MKKEVKPPTVGKGKIVVVHCVYHDMIFQSLFYSWADNQNYPGIVFTCINQQRFTTKCILGQIHTHIITASINVISC